MEEEGKRFNYRNKLTRVDIYTHNVAMQLLREKITKKFVNLEHVICARGEWPVNCTLYCTNAGLKLLSLF